MFKWIRSLFARSNYVWYGISFRGRLIHKTRSYAEAEKFIRTLFERADSQSESAKRLRFFGTTRRKRWDAFKTNYRITKIEHK